MQNGDKNLYEKKIVYLDYLERGEKIKNGGHVKWEARGDVSRVQIQIRGLYPTDTLQGEIRLLSFENSVLADKIMLNFGTGEYVAQWNNQDLAGTQISFEECDGVMIRLSENRQLIGQWRKRQSEKVVPVVEGLETKAEPESVALPEQKADLEIEETLEEIQDNKVTEMSETLPAQEEQEAIVPEPEISQAACEKAESKETAQSVKKQAVLVSDKWEQLNCYYPKIHPFGDKREYLSITPRDFVVLAGKYHNLVHNSFLLHGYYNYGHVVLTKMKEGQEDIYYLGVPGVYFDREKQAAVMFGFEGFEADSDQISEGGFGYYMKKVEI